MQDAHLPKRILPVHYGIVYKRIDFEQYTFEGSVTLQCKALQSTIEGDRVRLKLHAAEIQLAGATLTHDEATVRAEEFRYHGRDQTCEITFSSGLSLAENEDYVVTMDFHGILNDKMRGFYRSTYHALDGSVRIMATTQFEATDARRAFPCFDEPALKATFEVTVTIPAHMQCVSNTPPASQYSQYSNGVATKTITFQRTPKMSTYLLAFVIGEFDSISKTSGKIVTTVYTTPGKASQATFCLDLAVRALDFYQELFHVPYPLIKSDLLAIPDFAAGAMENWGCVTYREAKILLPPTSSESIKRGMARTLCHELAHQWFGNLVTMEWWTQLYLKEGMARYMEFVAVNHCFPDWNVWVEFAQAVYGLAQNLDSMRSSHPVEVEVHHPDEINEIFDTISYAKGASIIRMIAAFIGNDAFYEGLRVYLNRHQYGNAVTCDLWRALEEVSNKPVIDLMLPWTKQVGFPIVKLTTDGSIQIERFFGTGPEEENSPSSWPVPITARVEGVPDIQGPWLLNGPQGDQRDELEAKIREWSNEGKWFKLNVDQTGFFRVAYTHEQWRRLASAVMNPSTSPLSTTDRLGLVSDSFAAGRAGYSSIVESLELVSHFGEHDVAEYAVWEELSENFLSLVKIYRSEAFFPKLQTFIKAIFSKQMTLLGWNDLPGEDARMGTLRSTVISMMGTAGDAEVILHAYHKFLSYINDGVLIDGDLQQAVFHCALRHDETSVFDKLRKIFENIHTSPEEKRNVLIAMGGVQNAQRQQEVIRYVLESGKVRLQDFAFALGELSSATDAGGIALWRYFQSHYDELHELFGEGTNLWSAGVGLSCGGVSTTELADEVEAFFSHPQHPVGSAKRRLEQALETVRTRISRRERDRDVLARFFDNI